MDNNPIQIHAGGKHLTAFGYKFGPYIGGDIDEVLSYLTRLRNTYRVKLQEFVLENKDGQVVTIHDDGCECFVLFFGAIIGSFFMGSNRRQEAETLKYDLLMKLKEYGEPRNDAMG